jgi:TolB-like protein/Tfp pilus assembly protein PilF
MSTGMVATPTRAQKQAEELRLSRPAANQDLEEGARRSLDSWKEIAAYLKRGVRTVRRWERQEGLPVHRHSHSKQATVYAFPPEIDKWLEGRSADPSSPPPIAEATQPAGGIVPGTDSTVEPGRPIKIAVLPLGNLSGDPAQERFADGLTEEIILDIGNCCPGNLRVIALTSVMQYKQSTKSIAEIGRELGVDYILEGGIRRYGRRVRLHARLIVARDQAHIWADTYEIQLSPVFSLQQTLARQLAISLSSELRLTPSASWHRAVPQRFAAHNVYIEGRSFFLPTDEDIKKKLEYFNLALDRDPNFARTYSELALVYFPRLFRDYPPVVTLKRIGELASSALKLDSRLARAHAMLAAFYLFGARNWPKAEASSRRAIKLNPSDPWGWIIRAAYRVVVDEPAEAIKELEQARQLGPQSPDLGYWFAVLGYFARHYDWAIARCQEMLQLNTCLGVAHAFLGACYAHKGELALALNHCEKARELGSGSIIETARACSTYALAGRRDAAESLLQDLVAMQEHRYVRYIFLAQASVALGNDQQAVEWLEKAYEQRDPILVLVKADARFDSLSGVPRFRNLLRRIGLHRASRALFEKKGSPTFLGHRPQRESD